MLNIKYIDIIYSIQLLYPNLIVNTKQNFSRGTTGYMYLVSEDILLDTHQVDIICDFLQYEKRHYWSDPLNTIELRSVSNNTVKPSYIILYFNVIIKSQILTYVDTEKNISIKYY